MRDNQGDHSIVKLWKAIEISDFKISETLYEISMKLWALRFIPFFAFSHLIMKQAIRDVEIQFDKFQIFAENLKVEQDYLELQAPQMNVRMLKSFLSIEEYKITLNL